MTPALLGFGTALPPTRLSREQSESITRATCGKPESAARALRVLYRQSGVDHRHVSVSLDVVRDLLEGTQLTGSPFVPSHIGSPGPSTAQRMDHYSQAAPLLAAKSSREALADANLRPEEITHLVTISCTGFAAPGVDIALIQELSLPPSIERTHVGFMGCHGALNGLRVARALACDPAVRVLVCAVELCSLHFHYGDDPQRLVANALFADGAAAVVVGQRKSPWNLHAHGSCLFPESTDAMTWTIGDHGFAMTLSPRVPGLIRAHLQPWLDPWLARHGLSRADIRSWAIHPGGPRILTDVEAALDLPEGTCETSRHLLAECGNMSSPTILFLLQRLRQAEAPLPCVALGFGPGLSVEAAVFL